MTHHYDTTPEHFTIIQSLRLRMKKKLCFILLSVMNLIIYVCMYNIIYYLEYFKVTQFLNISLRNILIYYSRLIYSLPEKLTDLKVLQKSWKQYAVVPLRNHQTVCICSSICTLNFLCDPEKLTII